MGIHRTCDMCGRENLKDGAYWDVPDFWKVENFETLCLGDGSDDDKSCATTFDKRFRPISSEITQDFQTQAREAVGKAAQEELTKISEESNG